MNTLTEPSKVFDYESAEVRDFVQKATHASADNPRDLSTSLYYAVRDGINYEIFDTDISDRGLRASSVITDRRGFCLHKSILYVSAARAVGIPARLLSATVTNHLSNPQIESLVGGSTFLHWLTEVHIDDRWVKTTPVFNSLMCRLYSIPSLDFDGVNDAVHHAYDTGKQMQFTSTLRRYDSPTPEQIREIVSQHHPRMVTPELRVPQHDRPKVALQ